MEKHPQLDIPVIVDHRTIFEVVTSLDIKMFPLRGERMTNEAFLKVAKPEDAKKLIDYGPKPYVQEYWHPHNDEPYFAFKCDFKAFACVVVLVDGMMLLAVEWKGGTITIAPICGTVSPAEKDLPTIDEQLLTTAIREVREEAGIVTNKIYPLTGKRRLDQVVRNSTAPCYLYGADLTSPLEIVPVKRDPDEHIELLLMPVTEWMALLSNDAIWDEHPDFSRDTTQDLTLTALLKMGRLKLA